MRKPILAALFVLLALPATAATLDRPALERDLARLQSEAGTGKLGVAVRILSGGDTSTVLLHGDERFPLQSAYKFPIAVAALRAVDAGRVDLAVTERIDPDRFVAWHSPIVPEPERTIEMNRGELLRRMLIDSDNTATDAVLEFIGGPAAVQQALKELKIDGVRVDRNERNMQSGMSGVAPSPRRVMMPAINARTVEQQQQSATLYLADPRDTATPLGMLELLAAVDAGSALSKASTERLLRTMTETRTGPDRLIAGLPAGAKLAHKTGSSGVWGIRAPATNDVGIVTMGDGTRFAVVALLRDSDQPEAARHALLASVARAAVAALRP